MTLYLLFEQLDKGAMTLQTRNPDLRARGGAGAVQARHRARRHDQRRGRDQGGRDPLGQRHRGRDRRGDRPRRKHFRRDDDAQGARARHVEHDLSQRLGPAQRRADHHRARPDHPRRARSRSASRATSTISRPHEFDYAGEIDRQPQPSARPGRRRRRHQDRLHPRLRLQSPDLGASRRPLAGRRGDGRPHGRRARPDHGEPDRRPYRRSLDHAHRDDGRRRVAAEAAAPSGEPRERRRVRPLRPSVAAGRASRGTDRRQRATSAKATMRAEDDDGVPRVAAVAPARRRAGAQVAAQPRPSAEPAADRGVAKPRRRAARPGSSRPAPAGRTRRPRRPPPKRLASVKPPTTDAAPRPRARARETIARPTTPPRQAAG